MAADEASSLTRQVVALAARLRAAAADDRGSASLEFVTMGVLLLVPLVYLVLTIATVQAAALGAEGAARQAARVFVQAPHAQAAHAAAERAVTTTLADYGMERTAAQLSIACAPHADCLTRGNAVTVRIDLRVPLPLAPPVLAADLPLSVPVEARATQQVSRFWSGG